MIFKFSKRFSKKVPLDTGRTLNVPKTFRRRPGRLLNVLCTFSLRPVLGGVLASLFTRQPHKMGVFDHFVRLALKG